MSENTNSTIEKNTDFDQSQTKDEQSYYLIDFLSKNSFYNRPLSITDLISNLDRCTDTLADFLLNHIEPAGFRLGPLMRTGNPKDSDARKAMERKLRSLGTITCADVANAYDIKDLMSFQIVRRFKHENQLVTMDLQNSPDKTTRSKTLVHLTYRYNPYTLKLADENEAFDFSSEDYLHQISARWQYALDLICDFPHIRREDASALHSVLRHMHTLGEIPERLDLCVADNNDSDKECIDFNILSKILRYLHTAYKYQSICAENPHLSKITLLQGDHDVIKKKVPVIPLLEFTMGSYSPKNGKPTLERGEQAPIKAYPVCTRVWNGIYYLAVRYPNKKGQDPKYRYLRFDHILDCKPIAKEGTIPYDSLGTPPDIEQELYGSIRCAYTVTDCPEKTLIEIIDTFGKSCISSARKENDFWSFDIIIQERRKKMLYALHDEQYIHPCRTSRENDTTAMDYRELMKPEKELWEQFKDTLKPSNINITTDAAASENDIKLIPAIQSRNREEILHILEDRTDMFDQEDMAWIGYTAMPLDADIYEKLLTFFPKDSSSIVHLPAFPPLLPAGSFSLISVAAFYNRPDIMKLLIEHGASPNWEEETCCSPLATAIEYGSTECVEYLLTLDNLNKELTDELLQALAKAGSNEKISAACAIAASELLGCQLVKNHYTPFPKKFALRHVAQPTSLLALMDFCSLHTEELTVNDAAMIARQLPLLQYAEDIMSSADIVLNFLFQACPPLLETEEGRYIALVAALHPASFRWGAELLQKIEDPKIALLPCPNHNWFGNKGMLTQWEKVRAKINKHRKTPLQLVIDRNKALPCDPDRIDKNIMNKILSDFEIVGDTPQGELSKLAKYALKYASIEKLTNSKLIEAEDPQALKAYRSDLEEFSSIPATRSKEIVKFLKNTKQD